jgi:serine/threonine-protein kinase ATR
MQLLRDNKDTLMSILDAFIHDPLVEWRDEKRRQVSTNLKFLSVLPRMLMG